MGLEKTIVSKMDDKADVQRLKVLLEGRVQGVSMRFYTQQKASELGLTGYVRNLTDGRVEAVFEGPKPSLDAVLKWCQTGSPNARIDSIAMRYEEAEGRFSGFNVR